MQPDGAVLLPIGYSPFLHAWTADQPEKELTLGSRNGYTFINQALPIGTSIHFKAITPVWLSAVTWFSVLFTSGLGAWLLFSKRLFHT